MGVATPHQFINRGNLFIVPVAPSIAEVPYPTQTYSKPRDYSLWVRGRVEEPEFQLDNARMPPSLYQDVRDDLVRYSPVPVSRSAFRRSQHAYVGVIDSLGKPYYFALDSRGISVRTAPEDDDRVWKTFDRLSDHEHAMALRQRREEASKEVAQVGRELSAPMLVVVKSVGERYASEMRRVGAEIAEQVGDEDLDPPREDDVGKSKRRRRYRERTGPDAWRFRKALPKKPKETPVKKQPSQKATKKQVGAGGKTRYTYPQERKGAGAKNAGPVPLPAGQPEHDDTKHAEPGELANQLGVSVRTLQSVARKLGREGFSKFMRSHLKRFSAKHRLSTDYWGTLYERLKISNVLASTGSY